MQRRDWQQPFSAKEMLFQMTAGHLDDLAGSVAAGQFDAAAQGSGWRGIAQTANHNHEVLLADSISSGLLLSDCKAADYCTRQ